LIFAARSGLLGLLLLFLLLFWEHRRPRLCSAGPLLLGPQLLISGLPPIRDLGQNLSYPLNVLISPHPKLTAAEFLDKRCRYLALCHMPLESR